MCQKQNYFEVNVAWIAKKLFIFKLFRVGFFHIFLTKLLINHQLKKVLRYMEFTRKILKDQLHLLKSFLVKM
jgi:hypothetical protein